MPERLYFKPASFYDADNIEVRLDTRIESIDRDAHRIRTTTGEDIAYDKLILAIGSRARRVPVPGAGLPGVHYLRSIADVDAIREEIAKSKRLVIIGRRLYRSWRLQRCVGNSGLMSRSSKWRTAS